MTTHAAKHLNLLKISARIGPEDLRAASAELRAAGLDVCAEELRDALRAARAYQNPVTGEWTVPGATPPVWGYDDLQNALRSRANLSGQALFTAWQKVKGHLRVRVAAGNVSRPADHVVVRWATTSAVSL
jgi:hypothetical protein